MDSRDMLTGALIALSTTAGRATQQLTDETDDIVIGGVAACCGDAPNDAALNAFAERAHEENLRLAKESEGVANADFDMENLEEQDENVKALKRMILAGLRDVASPTLRARNKELSNPEVNAFFRAVLYTIGGQEAATGSLIELSTKVGEVNWYVCEALGQATNADDEVKKVADGLIAGLKDQTIGHVFFIGGGNADEEAYDYYTEFAQSAPKNSVFVSYGTIGDRLAKLDLGTAGAQPRFVNLGSRADVYTAVQTSIALANEFNKSANDLPMSFLVSQHCEEGVAALLTLLWIGIENVSFGPVLPEYLPEKALNFFKQAYALKITGNAQDDLNDFLN